MQIGNINIKLVLRKLQNHERDTQVMMLAGFTEQITHRTAAYVETLSPNETLTQVEIDAVIDRLKKHANAVDYTNITHPNVLKKIGKYPRMDTPEHFL